MSNYTHESVPDPEMLPPWTLGDDYLLPEYSSAFIKFVGDAQWHLIFANAPIVKEAFDGKAPYAIPESFGRSISTAGGDEVDSMYVETSGFDLEFTLTPKLILAGEYSAFADSIAANLPQVLEELVPVVTKSLQDQGALVKFDQNANFWEQLLDWMSKISLRFSEDGTVSLDHLRMFGQGDFNWINEVSPTQTQLQRWESIIETKRLEYFAKQGRRRLVSDRESSDQAQISKMIKLIQVQSHEKFLCQYGTPEYESSQTKWFLGLAHYEIMHSPFLAAYHQLYVKLGLREATSAGTDEGTRSQVPQRKLVLEELMPISDVIAGNYLLGGKFNRIEFGKARQISPRIRRFECCD